MQLRETSGQVDLFGLESTLFGVCELFELEICDRIIEIGFGVIQRIEIPDIARNTIQRIEIQDVIGEGKKLGPILCLVSHQREGQVRRQELGINSGGLGKRGASSILLVFLLQNGAQLKPGVGVLGVDLYGLSKIFLRIGKFALFLGLEAFLISFSGIFRCFVGGRV